jgi:anaerobic magnesium-protoporphyrin IX monomethyl ester cyclase
MKVVLINPAQSGVVNPRGRIYNRVWPPLDLATTAAWLEQDGIAVSIIDANAEQLSPEDVAARVGDADQVFVTSSSLDRWQCPHLDLRPFLAVVRAVRTRVPAVFVMGSHGTVRPDALLEMTGATAVVRGEPEQTVREIASGRSLSEILGVTWRGAQGVVSQPDQHPVPMGTLLPPALHLLPMDRYHYEVMGPHFTLFEMSRGCASSCSFCLLQTYGTGVRKKPLDAMLHEIHVAVTQFGVRHAYFIDLEFTVLRQQVIQLCEALIAAKLPLEWCCQTRLDLVDDELLALMKRAGCRLIHAGVEAGSDRVLSSTGKELTLDEVRDGMARIKRAGIDTACFFLLGLPGADVSDAEDLVRTAMALAPTYPLFHVVAPYPGTAMYDAVAADPRYRFSDDSLFPEAIEGPLTLPELKALTRKAYLRYYLRPAYIVDRLRRGHLPLLWTQARLLAGLVRR